MRRLILPGDAIVKFGARLREFFLSFSRIHRIVSSVDRSYPCVHSLYQPCQVLNVRVLFEGRRNQHGSCDGKSESVGSAGAFITSPLYAAYMTVLHIPTMRFSV